MHRRLFGVRSIIDLVVYGASVTFDKVESLTEVGSRFVPHACMSKT